MTRTEALKKELDLKAQLRIALNGSNPAAEAQIRAELDEVRKVIGTRTVEEAYGSMAY